VYRAGIRICSTDGASKNNLIDIDFGEVKKTTKNEDKGVGLNL
jgi:hypothetical protein